MSTISIIAVKVKNDYNTIYCHWDGYPEYMMPILTKYYNTEELALKLTSFGNASVIAEKLEPSTDTHCFNTPEPDVCIFYHRDRQEPWEWNSPETLSRDTLFTRYSGDYVYIFENGFWTCYLDGKVAKVC
jgi:hypothetical protein